MFEHDEKVESSFGTVYFFLGLVGVYFLIMGLLKQDSVLRIAVYGPLLIGALGVFVLILTVDLRHGLSSILQSMTSSYFHRLSHKESSHLLNVILLFLILNLVWLSAFFLPRNATSWFGLALLSAAGLFPLLLGKFLSASTSLLPSSLGEGENSDEFKRISNALLSDAQQGLNARQKMMIFSQKEHFRKHLLQATKEKASWSRVLARFETAAARSPEMLRSQLLEFLEKEALPYFSFFMKNADEFNEFEQYLIEANFLMDVLGDLLRDFADQDEQSPRLKWSLGLLLSKYILAQQSQQSSRYALPTIEAGMKTSDKIWDNVEVLYAQVLKLMANSNKQSWDPWFLCTYQMRLREMVSGLARDEQKRITETGRGLKPNPMILLWQSSVFNMLLDLPETSTMQRSSLVSSRKYASTQAWLDLSEGGVDEASFKEIAEPILSALPVKRKTFIHQLLILMLVLSFQQ